MSDQRRYEEGGAAISEPKWQLSRNDECELSGGADEKGTTLVWSWWRKCAREGCLEAGAVSPGAWSPGTVQPGSMPRVPSSVSVPTVPGTHLLPGSTAIPLQYSYAAAPYHTVPIRDLCCPHTDVYFGVLTTRRGGSARGSAPVALAASMRGAAVLLLEPAPSARGSAPIALAASLVPEPEEAAPTLGSEPDGRDAATVDPSHPSDQPAAGGQASTPKRY